jgi:hypothetical protein
VGEVEDCIHLLSVWCGGISKATGGEPTLLDAVLLGAALRVLGGGDALDALVKVVLGLVALLGVGALCSDVSAIALPGREY